MTMNHHHIIGHRGARAEAPENTLGGFRYLRNLGIQKVELDVHLSEDKQLIVIHDPDTLRTTGVSHAVKLTQSSILAGLNAIHQFQGPWGEIEIVPTLNAVMGEWPLLEHIQIEVKPLDTQQDRLIMAEELSKELKKHTFLSSITVITSSDWDFLEISKKINHVPHGVVVDTDPVESLVKAKKIGCDLFVLNHELYSEEMAKACVEAQMPVSIWTVNDVETALLMVQRGADTIITDTPQAFLNHISLTLAPVLQQA